jgi:membrane protease YdiL (CAAX protease family)
MPAPSTPTAQANTRLRRFAQRHPLSVFFSLAYLLGWISFLPLVLTNAGLGWIRTDVTIEFIYVGVWTPTLAALYTQWLLDRNFRICPLYGSWQRLVLGSVVGLALIMLAFVVLPGVVLAKVSPQALHWSALLTPVTYGVNLSTFLGGPIGEEPGWRGFALPRLQTRFGPVTGSILLGLLWAGWHLPLFFIHGWVNVSVWAFALIEISLSVLMTWGTNLSRFSIIVPILMHAAFNTSSRLLAALTQGLPTREPDLPYYLGAGGAAALVAILLSRGRLGKSSGSASIFPVQPGMPPERAVRS